MNNCTFIIFGASGDLTRKKLIPAIYNIVKNKKIDNFAILGAAKDKISVKQLIKRSRKYISKPNLKILNKLEKNTYYHTLDFYDNYEDFSHLLDIIEKKHKTRNRLFYLATLPKHFKTITENISKYNLAKENNNWIRVVFEKPFGDNLNSAKKINKCIKKVFNEKQIYRIDHYLGKELVQNMSILRFTNEILKPVWNNKHIDNIQIILSENIGVKDRANFYDKYGVIKDVVQNHALQMLALTAMDEPKNLKAKSIRDNKVKILKNTKVKKYILGQYIGYEVKNSLTPTFSALELAVNTPKFKGIPFYIIAGKNMKKKTTAINIEFKNSACKLLEGVCSFSPNHLRIQIQPQEGFHVHLNSKVPGKMNTTQVKMDFCHECRFGPNSPEAYENLLVDVIKGDQSVFIRTDEIEYQWKIVDKIKNKNIIKYKKGSHPKEANKITTWHLEE